MQKVVDPLLKWPGGKRWLAKVIAPTLRSFLQGIYYEPFLGGGAMFLSLSPDSAVLGDCNRDLIQFYQTLQREPDAVVDSVFRHKNTKDVYYQVRSSIPRSEVGKAARFLYLNRTCWGGVYRLNRNGEFNVPFGDSGRVICRRSHARAIAEVLSTVEVKCCDFSELCRSARTGDVVYCDPPYTTKGAGNGFLRYNEMLFSWNDQKRLAKEAKNAHKRGAFVAVSALNHFEVLELYKGWWKLVLRRMSLVGRERASRKKIEEVVLFSRRPNSFDFTAWGEVKRV